MKEDKLVKELKDIVMSFCRDNVTDASNDTLIRELEFDSVAYLNLFVEIEQRYDIDIDDLFTESFQTYTIQKFIDVVSLKILEKIKRQ